MSQDQDTIEILWTAGDAKFFQESYDFMKDNLNEQIFHFEENYVSPGWTKTIPAALNALLRIKSHIQWLKEDLELDGGACTKVDPDRIQDLYDTTRNLVTISKKEVFLPEFGWEIESECKELQYRLLSLKHAG